MSNYRGHIGTRWKKLSRGGKKACWISQLWTWPLHILPLFSHKLPKNLAGETLGCGGCCCLVTNSCLVLFFFFPISIFIYLFFPFIFISWRLITLQYCSGIWFFRDSMDHSPPGSSVHGILQARILEWAAISFSRGSYWPRNWPHVSCTGRRVFNH